MNAPTCASGPRPPNASRKCESRHTILSTDARGRSPVLGAGDMAKPDATDVASLLREYAQRVSLRPGNPYRAKAYARAADNAAALSEPSQINAPYCGLLVN